MQCPECGSRQARMVEVGSVWIAKCDACQNAAVYWHYDDMRESIWLDEDIEIDIEPNVTKDL